MKLGKEESLRKEREFWEKEGLMGPKTYKFYAGRFDTARKHYPELKDDLDRLQEIPKSHIYKKIGPAYDAIFRIAKPIYEKYHPIGGQTQGLL